MVKLYRQFVPGSVPVLAKLILSMVVMSVFVGYSFGANMGLPLAASQGTKSSEVASTSSVNISSQQSSISQVLVAVASTQSALTASTIAAHNTSNDCWLIVSGKVYDITSYIPNHPSGSAQIISMCGKDATQAFVGVGHSSQAQQLLSSFYVGDFGQTTSASTQSAASATSPSSAVVAPARLSSNHDDEEEEQETEHEREEGRDGGQREDD